jgi:hypothetical protein
MKIMLLVLEKCVVSYLVVVAAVVNRNIWFSNGVRKKAVVATNLLIVVGLFAMVTTSFFFL